MIQELVEKLQSIGLSPNEARIYIFLLQYKEAKASQISKKLGIATSHIYDLLNILLEKGLLSFKLVNNTKLYYPAPPQILYELFNKTEKKLQEQKQMLESFIGDLQKITIETEREADFKYFEGNNGVRSMWLEFIKSWKPKSILRIASAPLAFEKWDAFLLDVFHPPRIEQHIELRLIVPKHLENMGEKRARLKFAQVKYCDTTFDSEFAVCGDHTYLLSQTDKAYALLIHDKNFSKSQEKMFDLLWERL